MTGATGVIHVHSDYSHDGRDSLERIREFALERDLSFVGLTDHAEDFDGPTFARFVEHCAALSDRSVTLVPGLEFRFEGYKGLHLLALGLGSWIEPRTPEEWASTAPKVARFTVLAHPVLTRYQVPDAVLAAIDAVEVWNAAYNTRFLPDASAIRLLHSVRRSRPEVVGTAGLDQHDSRNDRETRIVLDRPTPDPLQALKAGQFTNAGRTMRFGPAVEWSPIRLGAFGALRWAYDRIERTQDRLARGLR